MRIKSFIGNHPVRIYADCEFDPSIRKYRAGRLIAEIPYSGRMLSAKTVCEDTGRIEISGVDVPVSKIRFTDVDALPDESECDYCIVSAMYVAACRELGVSTDRLLTISTPVVDENGIVIGTVGFNRN